MRRVLITVDRYYPIGGGIQQYLRGLAQALSGHGYEIYFLTQSIDGCPERERMPEGIVMRESCMSGSLEDPQIVLDQWRDIAAVIKQVCPDLVFANNHSSVGSIQAAKALDIPTVHCCHGWGALCPLGLRFLKPESETICMNERSFEKCALCLDQLDRLEPVTQDSKQASRLRMRDIYIEGLAPFAGVWKRRLKRIAKDWRPVAKRRQDHLRRKVQQYDKFQSILNSADRIISLSHKYKSFFAHDRTVVIPLGIDADVFRPITDRAVLDKYAIDSPYVLMTSRIHHIKGQAWTIEALRHLPSSMKIVLAGNSNLFTGSKHEKNIHTSEVRKAIEAAGVGKRVIFTGFVLPAELRALYSHAIATIVPSIWADPQPTVTIEAMACACPVIITANCGSSEAVDDSQNGIIINARDVKALAESVVKVQAGRDKFGDSARTKVVSGYSWHTIGQQVVDLFAQLVGN